MCGGGRPGTSRDRASSVSVVGRRLVRHRPLLDARGRPGVLRPRHRRRDQRLSRPAGGRLPLVLTPDRRRLRRGRVRVGPRRVPGRRGGRRARRAVVRLPAQRDRAHRRTGRSRVRQLPRSAAAPVASAGRLVRYADRLRPLARSAVVPVRHPSGVWNVPQTYLFAPATRARHVPIGLWARRPIARMRLAARERSLFHLWFHPYNVTAAPDRAGPRAGGDLPGRGASARCGSPRHPHHGRLGRPPRGQPDRRGITPRRSCRRHPRSIERPTRRRTRWTCQRHHRAATSRRTAADGRGSSRS